MTNEVFERSIDGAIEFSSTEKSPLSKILISQSGISSPMFLGKNKYYPWKIVASITVEMQNNQRFLQLTLNDAATKLTFPLTIFSTQAQEKIYETSHHYWREFLASNRQVVPTSTHQLKALAPIVWATWCLMAANILIWLAAIAQGTNIMQSPTDMLLAWGGNAASEVQRGQWWRLLTSVFLHGGLVHLAMNMLGLWSVGSIVERLYGRSFFLLIYLASGLMGSALSLHFSASHVVSVGASGAILGIAGALLVSVLFHKNELPKGFWKQTSFGLAVFIFYPLLPELLKHGIDNAAHIGGLICGSVLALFLPTQSQLAWVNKNTSRIGLAGALLAFASVGVVAYYAPPAQVDMKQSFEARVSFFATTAKLAESIKQLQKEAEDVKLQKMTAIEQDERSRTIWAPVFKGLYNEYDRHSVQATDPLFLLAQDYKRLTQLLQELLQMESVINPTTHLPEPANLQKAREMEAEVNVLMARINKA